MVKPGGETEPAIAAAAMSVPAAAAPALPGEAAAAVPKWFPAWAREFAEQYYAGSTCLFIFNGNVHDLVRQDESCAGNLRYGFGLSGHTALRGLGHRAGARPELRPAHGRGDQP